MCLWLAVSRKKQHISEIKKTKMKTKKSEPQKTIEKLLKSYSVSEIFCALTAEVDKREYKRDDSEWLRDEIILYLQIVHGCNVAKAETQAQQMEIEEVLKSVFPTINSQHNLFLQL